MKWLLRILAVCCLIVGVALLTGWPFEYSSPPLGKVDSSGLLRTPMGRVLYAALCVLGAAVLWKASLRRKGERIIGRWYW